ncbi:MAG TPA: hypothetical protein V6D47_20440, partial [Oscillatoriaceae cyanobacterium]
PLAPLDATQEKQRVTAALGDWLAAVSERTPVLLVLEDLQWADALTLEALRHLAEHAGACRLVCLGTFRDDEASAESVLWQLLDEGTLVGISLNPFGASELPALVAALLGPNRFEPAFYPWLEHVTQGNANFLAELLRCCVEEGRFVQQEGAWALDGDLDRGALPTTLEAALERRLGRLSDGALQLARVAAVAGRALDRALLSTVSGLTEPELGQGLDELLEKRLLDADSLALPHEALRQALYRAMPESQRQTIHARCARAFEEHADAPERISAIALAHHYQEASERSKAFEALREAAVRADATGAEALALEYRAQAEALAAAENADPALLRELRWEIGEAGFILAPGLAIQALEKLLTDSELDETRCLLALTFLAIANGFHGRPVEGLATLERAMGLLDDYGTPLHASLLVARCAALMALGHYDTLSASAAQAYEILASRDLSDEPPSILAARVGASAVRNAVCFQGIRPDEAIRDDALAAAERIDDPYPFTVMMYFGIWSAWTGRVAAAERYLAQTEAKCKRIGAPLFEWAIYVRAYLLCLRGAHEQALFEAEQGQAQLREPGLARQLLGVVIGQAHLGLGDLDAAEAAFTSVEQHCRTTRMQLGVMQALLGLGEVAIARRSWKQAEACLEEASRLSAGGPTRNPLHQAIAARLRGELALALGQLNRTEAFIHEAMAIVSRQENRLELSRLYALESRCCAARGDTWGAETAAARAEAMQDALLLI